MITKEQFIEGNKLIATFIGAKPCKDWQGFDGFEHKSYWHLQWSNRFQDNLALYSYRYSELQYHLDWNWLMLVVGRIRSLEICENFNMSYGVDVDIECIGFLINNTHGESGEKDYLTTVWLAIVDFIKWYISLYGDEILIEEFDKD